MKRRRVRSPFSFSSWSVSYADQMPERSKCHPKMASPPPKTAKPTTVTTVSPPFLRHLTTLDTTLSHSLHTITQPFLPKSLLLLLELSADFRLYFPVSLSLLFAPLFSPLRRPVLVPFLLGLVLDLALIGLTKLMFRRSRPVYNPAMIAAVSVDHFSFPSGHASRVCFVAAFFSLYATFMKDFVSEFVSRGTGIHSFIDPWIGDDENKVVDFAVLVVWVWAVLTSASRVMLGRHFVFDVFAGACLGVLEALFVFRFLRF